MLNILNLVKKNNIIRTLNKAGQSVSIDKRNIPSNKEWYNSIYAFDKNLLRFLPAVHDYVFKLLRGYFNMVSDKMETEVTLRKYKKINRSSGQKIWISTPEIKHLSDKINVTIYIYNREYNVYKNKLELPDFSWGPVLVQKDQRPINVKKVIVKPTKTVNVKPINTTSTNKINNYLLDNFIKHGNNKIVQTNSRPYSTDKNVNTKKKYIFLRKKIKLIKQVYPMYLGKYQNSINTSYYPYVIKWLKLDKLIMIQQYKSTITEFMGIKGVNINEILFYLRLERYDYLINRFKKELAYLKFKQKLMFNQFKFSELYITPIIQFLQTIYKKKIELNIVILKNYYLNSSILLQIIETKLRKTRARGRHLSTVDMAASRVKVPILSSNKLQRLEKINIDMQNVILNNFNIINKEDNIDQFLLTKNSTSGRNIYKLVLKNLENKCISGLFIKISGRLTKRYKAQRAVSTLRAKGTLKNVYSAHTGSPSKLSLGHSNINVEKTMIYSKNRIGAFGLTGWIASY